MKESPYENFPDFAEDNSFIACDQGKRIFVATSSNPTGPFSESKSIYEIEDRFHGHSPFFYCAIAHPEFINERGELLITYSINGYAPGEPDCVDGRAIADHYRPRAIRVPLRLIDQSM